MIYMLDEFTSAHGAREVVFGTKVTSSSIKVAFVKNHRNNSYKSSFEELIVKPNSENGSSFISSVQKL